MTTLHENEQALLERILESPRLPFYARHIQTVLDGEQDARRRFYETITEGDKAEFINGEAVYHSPVRLDHNRIGKLLLKLLDTYVTINNLGYVGYEKIMVSLSRNDYEPDLCYFALEKAAQFKPRQMRFPAPDFVVEILSESTAANDRGVKLEDYAAHGVGEYWIIDPVTEIVEQYLLADDGYELAVKVNDGPLRSTAVPGFEIPVRAIFDEAVNVVALQAILQSR
jgi:Uma2 family endonuclease